jgi:hypothetical protein
VLRPHLHRATACTRPNRAGRDLSEDDHELKQYLLRVALKNAELTPGAGRPALATETFANVAREFLLAEAVIDRVARVSDPRRCMRC